MLAAGDQVAVAGHDLLAALDLVGPDDAAWFGAHEQRPARDVVQQAAAGARRRSGVACSAQLRRWTTIAMPCPPPTHIVSRPSSLSRDWRPLSSVVVIRAPVEPNG